MQGRRTEYRSSWPKGEEPQVGDYWKDDDGCWGGVTPNGHYCNLAKHDVVEHEDRTITVSPSIRVFIGDQELWHGFLKKGVWELA
jgi:hypothetical protein